MTAKVLLVDDEVNVLHSIRRGLRGRFEVDLAEGGLAALQRIRNNGPYAVVVSDMQMPQVTGLQVLSEARRLSPDTVRVMLTGNADQRTASAAVNEGEIFRFLNKPCSTDDLTQTLNAAIRQYDRVTTEKHILSKTLTGSVGLITEVLSLVNPTAFGKAGRFRLLAKKICEKLNVDDAWQIEVAAMLAPVGCVAVPDLVLQKASKGQPLTAEERNLLDQAPKVGAQLVSKIPRLELISEMIAKQSEVPKSVAEYPGPGPYTDPAQRVAFGGFILRLLNDFDDLAEKGSMLDAVRGLQGNKNSIHPPQLLQLIEELTVGKLERRMVTVKELREKMILEENVLTNTGDILIAKGNEVTSSLIQRLIAFEQTAAGVRQPILVTTNVKP
jgi:response regulator RpfG family c-di-GMP phosphodiesterase